MNHLEIEIMKNVEPIYIENYNTAERNEGCPKEWRGALCAWTLATISDINCVSYTSQL